MSPGPGNGPHSCYLRPPASGWASACGMRLATKPADAGLAGAYSTGRSGTGSWSRACTGASGLATVGAMSPGGPDHALDVLPASARVNRGTMTPFTDAYG